MANSPGVRHRSAVRPETVGLVLASAATHAYWNAVVRRAGGDAVFIGSSKVVEAVLLFPALAVVMLRDPRLVAGTTAWRLVAVGAALTLANYVALGRAYASGHFGVAYPVARGGALVFLPVLGALVFGERVAPLGWAAVACIVAGIALLGGRRRTAPSPAGSPPPPIAAGVGYAIVAAFTSAAYTVWDKRAVGVLPAYAYFAAYTALVAAAYAAWMALAGRGAAARETLRTQCWPVVQVAVCNAASYLLVLLALRSGTSTYVVAARQSSVAFGALIGWYAFGESLDRAGIGAVALILAGALLVARTR